MESRSSLFFLPCPSELHRDVSIRDLDLSKVRFDATIFSSLSIYSSLRSTMLSRQVNSPQWMIMIAIQDDGYLKIVSSFCGGQKKTT